MALQYLEALKALGLSPATKFVIPLEFTRLVELLRTVQEGTRRRERLLTVDAKLARRLEFHGMTGRSPVMQDLFDAIRRIAPHTRTEPSSPMLAKTASAKRSGRLALIGTDCGRWGEKQVGDLAGLNPASMRG